MYSNKRHQGISGKENHSRLQQGVRSLDKQRIPSDLENSTAYNELVNHRKFTHAVMKVIAVKGGNYLAMRFDTEAERKMIRAPPEVARRKGSAVCYFQQETQDEDSMFSFFLFE